MLPSRALLVAIVGPAALLLAACGNSASHYSAERFKRCLVAQHVDVTLTRDVGTESTAAQVWQPRFAEWVYFFKTPEAAQAERVRLWSAKGQRRRLLAQLLRTQQSNVLVFAPEHHDWFSPIKGCLHDARV
jgi:hypothetical protein